MISRPQQVTAPTSVPPVSRGSMDAPPKPGSSPISQSEPATSQSPADSILPRSESGPFLFRLAYSVRETAAILGISEKSVRRLITRGLLRSSRALRHLLIPKKEIERFLDRTSAQ